MNHYHVPDRTIIDLTERDIDTLAVMQNLIYPQPLIEEKEIIEGLLKGGGMNFGVVVNEQLAGFLLSTCEYADTWNDIFLYDLGILPEHQRKGLGTLLLNHFLKEARQKESRIAFSCRQTSLSMFSDSSRLEKMGYRIAEYEFQEDGYFDVAGIHEDMHNFELEPF